MEPFRAGHRQDPATCGDFEPEAAVPDRGDYIICENPPGHFGIHFRCPCGCGNRYFLPIDPGPYQSGKHDPWGWNGERQDITLQPSILNHRCGWHGYLENGMWRDA